MNNMATIFLLIGCVLIVLAFAFQIGTHEKQLEEKDRRINVQSNLLKVYQNDWTLKDFIRENNLKVDAMGKIID